MTRSRSASRGRPKSPPDLPPVLRRAAGAALDLLLPPTCPTCETRVSQQGQLCSACFSKTHFISAPFCVRCGVPFASGSQAGADATCPSCAAHPPLFRSARAALRYDEQARKLILPLKHADRTELVSILAPMMARSGASLLAAATLLVPVPLHRHRLWQRRYNQAAMLAIAIGRIARRPAVPDALQRTRHTQPLEDKSPAERAQEVAGSITVRPSRAGRIAKAAVVLIDDVMTSGATANACAEALLSAGAASVDVLTAARVPDRRFD
jgi:ComF family protein